MTETAEEKLKMWAKATGEFCKWFVLTVLAIMGSTFLGYMIFLGRFGELPVFYFAVYIPVMAAIGIPIAYQGFKAVRGTKL